MDKRFLVFVVFAIVRQSSVLLSSAIFTGFPQQGALLNLLASQYYESRSDSIIGFNSFFDLLRNRTGQTSSNQDHSPYVDALSMAAKSTDIIYYSALIVAQEDCDEFDTALNETRAQLDEVIEKLVSSIASAQGGNYDENRSEIENNCNSIEAGLASAYATLFDLLRCCLNDSNVEFVNLLGAVQEKVKENYDALTNALYGGIEAYSILTSECTEEEAAAALASIEKNRFIAIATAVDFIEQFFCLYETSYIDNYLGGTDIVFGIFEIRIARKKTTDKLEESLNVVFAAITERLLAQNNHYEIESSSPTIAVPTQAIAVDLLLAANEHFLEIVSVSLPNSTDYVIVTKIIIPHVLSIIIRQYYKGMDLAEAVSLPDHLSLLGINSVKRIGTLVTNFVVGKYFEVIGSDQLTEAKLAVLQKNETICLHETNYAIFNAIEVLSKVAHANEEASQDELNEVYEYQLTAIDAARVAVRHQLHAVLYRYIVENGY